MYCKKVGKRDFADFDQTFSLNEPVLPLGLRELYAKCSLIFNVSLIFSLNILLSVAKMLGLE